MPFVSAVNVGLNLFSFTRNAWTYLEFSVITEAVPRRPNSKAAYQHFSQPNQRTLPLGR